MKGPYQDVKFNDFAGGLATKVEASLIEDNQSPDLQNIVFDGKGSFLPRQGNEIFGDSTSATGKIRRTWTMQNAQGINVALRVADDGTDTWVEYYNDQLTAWKNLDAGFTTGMEFGAAYYDYYIYWGNPKDTIRRWNGVSWSTSTYADSAYSRVDISTSAVSAIGFLSAGSVVLDGEEVYYSSINGTALSGITFTEAHDGGLDIAQLPTSAGEVPAPDGGWASASDNLPHGSIMTENDGQLIITGLSASLSSYNGNVLWYSTINEPTNFTISAVPGGGGVARYPETNGGINAVASFDTVLAVLKADNIRKLEFKELADGTSGSIEIVDRGKILTGQNIGAINHESLAQVENDTMYVNPAGWVKSLNLSDQGRKSLEASTNIRPTVEGLNMTSSAGIYYDGKYHLACATSESSVNNVVLVYDYEYRAWTKYIGWNVSDWFIKDGILYYGASNEIATYRAYKGYDDNDGAYSVYWNSKELNFGIPNEQKMLDQIYVEGYMTTNSKIGVSAFFDGDTNSPRAKSILGTGDYISTTDNITVIGSTIWGSGIYGGGSGSSSYNLKKFRVNLKYARKHFYDMQIKIGSNSPGFVYKITHIVPYLAKVPGKRIPTNNLI